MQALTPDYSKYNYIEKWESKGVGSTQGFDIFDDKVFWVSKSGNGSSDNKMYIFNLSDGSYALGGDRPYITAYGGHGNCVTFSNEYYEAGDNIPLVMMSTAYENPVYLNRINNEYQASIVMRYVIPLLDGVVNEGFDICYSDIEEIAYVVSVFGSNSDSSLGTHICIAKFNLADLTDNGDGTYTPSLISSIQSPWHYWKQGIKYHDGLIWLSSGYTNLRGYVYGIDPNTGEVKYTIDTQSNIEIEGAVWYPDENAVGGYALYIGFQGMLLRKYTFQELAM